MTAFAQGVWILFARKQYSTLLACRSKLSIAQSRANQCEIECSSLLDDNASLSCQVARAEGHLMVIQAKLRCAVLCCAVLCCAALRCAVPRLTGKVFATSIRCFTVLLHRGFNPFQIRCGVNKCLTLLQTPWACRLVVWARFDTSAMDCTDVVTSAHHRDNAYASQHLPNSLPLF